MTDRDPLRGQALADALAEAFDSLAPNDRAAAEAELREVGVDPRGVGQSLRAAADEQRHSRATIPTRPARALWTQLLPLAAMLAFGVGVGWWWRGGPPEQLAAAHLSTAQPRLTAAVGANAPVDAAPIAGGPSATPTPARHISCVELPVEFDDGRDVAPAPLLPNVEAPEPRTADEWPVDAAWHLGRRSLRLAKALLPASVAAWIERGDAGFTVVSPGDGAMHDNYPPSFWAASDANDERFYVDPNDCRLRERATDAISAPLTGLPFPKVDGADAAAGCEVMWNVEATTALSGARSATATIDALDRDKQRDRLVVNMQATSFAEKGAAKPDSGSLRAARRLVFLGPDNLRGTAYLTERPGERNDLPDEPDRTWAYDPKSRHVRTIDAAGRTGMSGAGLFGLDDFNCFDGRLEQFRWKVTGESDALVPVLSPAPLPIERLSATRSQLALPNVVAGFERPDATTVAWSIDGVTLVRRPVWIVEGEPRESFYAYGRIVLYVDRELYRPYWKLLYTPDEMLDATGLCSQYWARSSDGSLAATGTHPLLIVSDRRARADLLRIQDGEVFDQQLPEDWFSMKSIIASQ